MNTIIDKDQMRELLREFVIQYESQTAAAKVLSVSAVFLSDLLRGRKEVTPRIAEQLGYERDYWYMPKPID